MSAVIVNEGVPGYEGTLFNGLKFYIHPQIPSKSWRTDRLKQNGAKVVLLEKHADIVIGDPSFPKRAPPNAVSFKYIDDCIKEGKLCDIKSDEYQIRAPPTGRPGVPSTGAKGTRTPFTDDDDKILVRWVIEHERKGESLKGNKIYDMLAQAYPNHTSQSWRNRWVKNFDHVPRSNLDKYLEGPDLPPPLVPRHAEPRNRAVSRPPPAVSDPQLEQKATKKRAPFTAEEDELLLEHVARRVKAGKAAQGNAIYQELEEEYPRHTYHSWRARYIHLAERGKAPPMRHSASARQSVDLTAEDSGSRPSASGSLPPRDTSRSRGLPAASGSVEGRQATSARQSIDLAADQAGRRPSASSSLASRNGRSSERLSSAAIIQELQQPSTAASPRIRTSSNIIKKDKLTPQQRLEVIRSAKNLQRFWRGYKVRLDLRRKEPSPRYATPDTPEPIEMWGATNSPTDGVSAPADQPPPSSFRVKVGRDEPTKVPEQRVADKEEKKFYARLKEFQKFSGIIPGYKTVGITLGGENMVMPLWNLWSAATKQHADHSLRDWKQIATTLEISWETFPGVTEQLKAAFEKSLLRLEEVLAGYTSDAEGDEDSSDDSDEEGSEPGSQNEDEEYHSPAAVASSPPPVTTAKRGRDQIEASSEAESAGSPRKRRRYNNKDEEMACSPELTRGAPPATLDRFPSPQLLPLLPKTTPRGSKVHESIEHDLDEQTPTRQRRPETSNVRRATVEESDSDDAFDPPDDSRPAPRRPSQPVVNKARRRTLPNGWAKPAQPGPSGQSKSPVMLPPQWPAPKKSPPSRQPPPTPLVQKPQTQTPQQPNIDHFISLGYDEDTVMEALEATTNDIGLAGQVMESIRDGRGIPPKVAGVWTSRDDRALDLCHIQASGKLGSDVDKRRQAMLGRERIIKKHGDVRCRARAKYLGKMPWA